MPLNSIVPDISEGDEDIDAVINRIAAEAERNMVTMTTSFCQTFLCAQLATRLPCSSLSLDLFQQLSLSLFEPSFFHHFKHFDFLQKGFLYTLSW